MDVASFTSFNRRFSSLSVSLLQQRTRDAFAFECEEWAEPNANPAHFFSSHVINFPHTRTGHCFATHTHTHTLPSVSLIKLLAHWNRFVSRRTLDQLETSSLFVFFCWRFAVRVCVCVAIKTNTSAKCACIVSGEWSDRERAEAAHTHARSRAKHKLYDFSISHMFRHTNTRTPSPSPDAYAYIHVVVVHTISRMLYFDLVHSFSGVDARWLLHVSLLRCAVAVEPCRALGLCVRLFGRSDDGFTISSTYANNRTHAAIIQLVFRFRSYSICEEREQFVAHRPPDAYDINFVWLTLYTAIDVAIVF